MSNSIIDVGITQKPPDEFFNSSSTVSNCDESPLVIAGIAEGLYEVVNSDLLCQSTNEGYGAMCGVKGRLRGG